MAILSQYILNKPDSLGSKPKEKHVESQKNTEVLNKVASTSFSHDVSTGIT